MKPNFGVFFLCAALSTTLFAGDSEVIYKGRPMSYWLLGYSQLPAKDKPGMDQANDAVARSGMASVQSILNFDGMPLPYRSHVVRMALIYFYDAHPEWTNQAHQLIFQAIKGTNRIAQVNAMEGVPCAVARQALPAMEALTKSSDAEIRDAAFSNIGRCFGVEKAKELGWVAPTNLPSGPTTQHLIMKKLRLQERLRQNKEPEQSPAPALPNS